MTLNYGWALFKDATIKVACKDISLDHDFTVDSTPLPDDDRVVFSMGEMGRTLYLTDCYFKSHGDAELFLAAATTYNKDSSPFKFEWQIHSDGGKFKIDGTLAYMNCYFSKIGRLAKKSLGDNDVFFSPLVVLIQA